MVIAVDFSGLHVWAQALAVILLLELIVLLVIVAALMLILMLGARWLQMHVIPLLNATVPRAKQALEITNQSTDRVVRGVAEVHGWRSAVEAGLKVLFQGNDTANPAREPAPPATTPGAAAATPAEMGTGHPDGTRATSGPASESRPFAVHPDERVRWPGERTPPPAAHAG